MILTQHSIADLVASSGGWPRPALAASRLHAGCMIVTIPIMFDDFDSIEHCRPRGLIWMAFSSIGSLAATCWMYDYHHTHYHLSLMILTQQSIADLVASSGWPCPALAASRLHAGCMIIIIPIII